MISWLASYPRSGNTWFRMIYEYLYKVSSYTVYSESPSGFLSYTEPFNPRLEPVPCRWHLVKTHEQDDALTSFPAILVVRDGRDAMTSYARHRQIFEGDTRAYSQILKNLVVALDWTLHTRLWINRPHTKVVVKFETLLARPKETVRDAVIAAGLADELPPPDMDVELPTLAQLRTSMPNTYRRGCAGGWKQDMPVTLESLFWHYHGDTMKLLGYER